MSPMYVCTRHYTARIKYFDDCVTMVGMYNRDTVLYESNIFTFGCVFDNIIINLPADLWLLKRCRSMLPWMLLPQSCTPTGPAMAITSLSPVPAHADTQSSLIN